MYIYICICTSLLPPPRWTCYDRLTKSQDMEISKNKYGLGFTALGLGFRIQGFGFRVPFGEIKSGRPSGVPFLLGEAVFGNTLA